MNSPALRLLALVLCALPLAAAAAPKPKAAAKPAPKASGYHPRYTNAPADEYFGRLKLSILGVRNKVKDMGLDADLHPEHDAAILSGAVYVEDAMRDWARKYPFDHWLPRYAFALETIYERMPGAEPHKRALRQLSYITAYFPQTVYGRVGRAKIAQGVPTPEPGASLSPAQTDLERLAFIDGKVLPTLPPAAAPAPVPSPETSPEPAASPSPAPSPSPRP